MKFIVIVYECARLGEPKVSGLNAETVNHLRTQLCYTRWLVGLSATAISLKGILVLVQLSDFPSGLRGKFLLSQIIPMLLFAGCLVIARIILASFWARHGERDFDVEVVEQAKDSTSIT